MLETPVVPVTQDLASPYFINANENATLPLVYEKFNGEGYGEENKYVLASKNNLVFIDGFITKPAATNANYSA